MKSKYIVAMIAAAIAGSGAGVYQTTAPQEVSARAASCTTPAKVMTVVFSASKYPAIKSHWEQAAASPRWPSVLTINRRGADERRDELMDHQPPQPKGDGFDLDEYPPAMSRKTWPADVKAVPQRQNRSHGSTMGAKLRRLCDGARWRPVFR